MRRGRVSVCPQFADWCFIWNDNIRRQAITTSSIYSNMNNMKDKCDHIKGMLWVVLLVSIIGQGCRTSRTSGIPDRELEGLRTNASEAAEGFRRSHRYMKGWLAHADSATGLIPRNLRESRDFWNAWDAGADNYPYLVLTASILDSLVFSGVARTMLNTEERLTSRIGCLPDNYSFSRRGFQFDGIDTNRILFGTVEYMKDGLIPLTEWLGRSAWSDRMLGMLADLPQLVRRATDVRGNWFGSSATVEVNGDLLQVLSRMYWFKRDTAFRSWAFELADYYLEPGHLPTVALDRLRIRDHGCEIISGLCEAYILAYYTDPVRHTRWRPHIHAMLDRILEVGRNADGLFYDEVDPRSGKVISAHIADNFGYTLNAYWHIAEIDGTPVYRAAVIQALDALERNYKNYNWENGSADGDADAVEGALNLYRRVPSDALASWLDRQIRTMWSKQQPDGVVEGWHGDGNFARTSIMYSLWKTQGVTPVGWNAGIRLGAIAVGRGIRLYVATDADWQGRLRFDVPRHRLGMGMPVDYPRINQFPEWFTVEPEKRYRLRNLTTGVSVSYSGSALSNGVPVTLAAGEDILWEVNPVD